MAVQTMTIPQFLNGSYRREPQIITNLISHLKRHRIKYRVIGTTVFVFLAGITVGFLIEPIHAFAASDAVTAMAQPTQMSIDEGGRKMYYKLLSAAKWVVIFRGAWESVSAAVKGDNEHAKKSFLSYAMVYLILLAFPWMMDQIDGIFTPSKSVSGSEAY
jgi:hypothetical protein